MKTNWEKEVPTLAGLEKKNPFSVPEGYFNELQEHLSSRIYLETIYSEKHEGKFKVPEGYFNELQGQIESRIISEKLKEQFVENSFTVPEGYFSSLQARITQKVSEPVKVVSMRKPGVPAWINYAAAACITVAVSAGLIFNLTNKNAAVAPAASATATVVSQGLSNVSDETIIDYLKTHTTRADMPAIIENVGEVSYVVDENIDSEDLQSYLDNYSL